MSIKNMNWTAILVSLPALWLMFFVNGLMWTQPEIWAALLTNCISAPVVLLYAVILYCGLVGRKT